MDSIIFDLDGTLWDATEAIYNSWSGVLKECKEVSIDITKEAIQGVMGLQMNELEEKLFPGIPKCRIKEITSACTKKECDYLNEHGGNLYPDLETTLQILSKKYKLFIVSNCESGYIEVFLKYHRLDRYITDFENPGRTGLSKGENIKLVITRNYLEEPVYVGDTISDQKGAQDAGIPFVYAAYGFGEVEAYDYKINQFSDLLKLSQQL